MCVRLKTKTCGCYYRISQNGTRNVEEMAISGLFFVACYCWSVNDWSYFFSFKDRTAAGLSVFVTQEPKGEKCSCGHLGGFLWKFQQLSNHYTPLFIKKKKSFDRVIIWGFSSQKFPQLNITQQRCVMWKQQCSCSKQNSLKQNWNQQPLRKIGDTYVYICEPGSADRR